jgi:hypothetical protein
MQPQPEAQTTTAGESICPPHHWLIASANSNAEPVERWTCVRCGGVRERPLAHRRATILADHGSSAGALTALAASYGLGGQRVG